MASSSTWPCRNDPLRPQPSNAAAVSASRAETSGASVPETLVQQVMGWLAERGYGEVTEVESAQEHLLFALPPELRRDLRKAGIAEG